MTAIARPRHIPRFIEVTSSREVYRAIKTAVHLVRPVRIIGAPGTGKTAALLHHQPEFNAAYCECAGFAKDIKGLFHLLIAAYEISTDARHTAELADVLYSRLAPDRLQSTFRPLLVDEWQTLEPPAQRELLRLAETCSIPLVLCGNAERLFSSRTHKAALAQIESRIAAEFRTPALSEADCDSISLDYNVEGKEAWALVRHIGANLEFRRLADVLDMAVRATQGTGSVQSRHLDIALRTLNSGGVAA